MLRFFFTPIRTKTQLLLMRATNALPQEHRKWGRAVVSELNGISGFWPSLEWIVGGMTAMSVDHSVADQTSITRFVEDNWLGGQRIGQGSFDALANSITQMFNFSKIRHDGTLFLNPNTGEKE